MVEKHNRVLEISRELLSRLSPELFFEAGLYAHEGCLEGYEGDFKVLLEAIVVTLGPKVAREWKIGVIATVSMLALYQARLEQAVKEGSDG